MLFVPMMATIVGTGQFTLDVLFLILSSIGAFMSYPAVHTLLQHVFVQSQSQEKLQQTVFWATAYLGFATLFIVPLFLKGFWILLPIGVLAAVSFFGNFFLTTKYPKTILSDLAAVFGLTLSAPTTYYLLMTSIDRTALVLWILNFLFFGIIVFYVHMKIKATALKKGEFSIEEKIRLGRYPLLYHIAVSSIVAYLVLGHYTSTFGILAFLPMTIHVIYGIIRLSSNVKFKNLGFLLLAHSVLFGIMLGILEGN